MLKNLTSLLFNSRRMFKYKNRTDTWQFPHLLAQCPLSDVDNRQIIAECNYIKIFVIAQIAFVL